MGLSNKHVLVVIIIYIALIFVQHAVLLTIIRDLGSGEMTGGAQLGSGQVRVCTNHAPVLNYTCPESVDQDQLFYCQVNVSDQDPGSFFFESDFFPPPDLFEISTDGVINFTPNWSQVYNYTFMVAVWDDSGCDNNLDYSTVNLNVNNVNDPPVLIMPIPNQSWTQDTSLSPFDLDNYFIDPDGDEINYTFTYLTNIDVGIDSDNIVTFTPHTGWSGFENIVFFAWDPYMANGSSNNVSLVVTPLHIPPVTPPHGGGGGGGGSSGAAPMCIPRWYCRPWGICEPDGIRRRECFDLNNCSTTLGKPNVTEPCKFISTCYDGFKGPGEENVDCGGPCPPCGSCYDKICNNGEDCSKNLTLVPDCGGPCEACQYPKKETCFDSRCNNGEDCTKGLTDLPDCGGPCDPCPAIEKPLVTGGFNWGLLILLLLLLLLLGFLVTRSYPWLLVAARKRKRKYYEERLLLEAKISESLFDSLSKIEQMIGKEDIQRLIYLFSVVLRRYFKALFELKYEFTYEELIKEIESRNISSTFKNVLRKFFERSTEMEFSGKSVSEQELVAMISEFKQIVSFTSQAPITEEEKVKNKAYANKIDEMFARIAEAEACLRKMDMNTAYFKYMALASDFKLLSAGDKIKLHGFLSRLYEEIKLAREKYDYEIAGTPALKLK